MKKLNKIKIVVFVSIALVLFAMFGIIFCGLIPAGEDLQTGSKYKLVSPVYLIGVYKNLNDRQLSRDKAFASLIPRENAKRAWMAFQCEVPTGTVMTIIGPAPKIWQIDIPCLPKRYFVRLDPDLSRGLDVYLELSRGLEGASGGVNPELFSRLGE